MLSGSIPKQDQNCCRFHSLPLAQAMWNGLFSCVTTNAPDWDSHISKPSHRGVQGSFDFKRWLVRDLSPREPRLAQNWYPLIVSVLLRSISRAGTLYCTSRKSLHPCFVPLFTVPIFKSKLKRSRDRPGRGSQTVRVQLPISI